MAENEIGRVSLGVELSTDPLSSQAADLERKVTSIAEKAGEKAGKKFADEAAKAFEKNANKIGEAGEKAGEEAGKGASKGLKSGSRTIETETGAAGEKAGKSFFSRFQKNASGASGGLKAIAGKIGKALVAAFAVKKIFDFGKLAVNLGSDLNEVQNVVDSTFGQGSDAQKAVDSFAKNAATQFGLSETMAKRYSGTFGAMGRAFGFTSDQAADMGTTLAGLSGDVASFYNITQDEAYTKLKSVFTGETESLKDLGVVMTQTALDQYALQQGLGRTTAHMTEQEKVALRYRFVLDKLSTASGDFARTSGSWANQVRLLKLQFESLAATIGQVLIAALTPAIRALNAFMGVLVKAANTFKSFVFSLFGLEASAMGTGSAGALPEALGDIGNSAGGAADGLGDMGDAAKGAGKDASKAANEIKRSLASFDKITKLTDQSDSGSGSGGSGGGGGSGGSGGGGGAGSLGDTSSALTNTAWSVGESGGPLDKILEKLKALKDMFIGGFWEGLGDLSVFDSIQKNIDGIGQHLKNIFTDPAVVKAASDWADTVAYNLGRMAGATVSVGATIADNITGGIEKYLEQHENDIKQALIRCFNISGDIYDITGDFATAFADVFSVFRSDEAKQTTANIISMFATAFDTVLETALKFGRDTLQAITKPFTDNKIEIKLSLDSAITQLQNYTKGLDTVFTQMSKTIGEVYDGSIGPLIRSIGEGVSGLVNTFLTAWNTHVSPVLEQISKKFADVCEAHVAPMLESLGQTVSSVFQLIKTLWENILQPLLDIIIKNLTPVLGDIAGIMGGALLNGIAFVSDAFKTLSDVIRPVIEFITNLIKKIAEFKPGDITKSIGDIAGKAKDLPEKVVLTISAVKDKAWDTVVGAFDKVKNSEAVKTIKGALGTAWESTKNAYEGLKNGEALKTVKGTVADAFKTAKTAFDGLKNGTITKTVTGSIAGAFNNAKNAFNGLKSNSITKTITGSIAGAFNSAKKAFNGIKSNTVTKKFDGYLTGAFKSAKDAYNKIKSSTVTKTIRATLSGLSSAARRLLGLAHGGVFKGGRWHPIQSFAEGGYPYGGQIFRARENGNPELVGTLNGSTAVMNNDQIVASVSSGVARAISGIKFYAKGGNQSAMVDAYLPRLADVGNGIRNDTSQLVAYAKQAEAAANGGNNAEVLELLRRILEVLLLIDPDVYIDGEKVTAKIISIINAQTRATGRPAIIV